MNTLSKLLRLGLVGALAALAWSWTSQKAHADEGQGYLIHITQVDKSQFPLIKVYVSVTDANGEPAAVAPERLTLAENGQTITPDSISGQGEIGPLTTLFVVDISGSMNEGDKLAGAKAAAQAYVDQMRPGDQAGLLTFNTEITYVQPVTADREALAKAIAELKAKNDTAMYDALVKGTEFLANTEGRKAIIVLTDGLDNRSKQDADQVIEQISPSGLSISTIGLGDASKLGLTNEGLDEVVLRSLAERAGGVYGFADNPESLRALYERYGRALQSEYVLTYTAADTLRNGVSRSLSVHLADADVSAQAVYNPGGVVPEVAQSASWQLFGVALAGLLGLLLLPVLLSRSLGIARGLLPGLGKSKKKGTRVRLTDEPKPSAQPRIRLR